MTFAIRPMTMSDLAPAHRLSSAIGWPHRIEDWQFVFGLGEGVVAEAEGRLVGTAMAWRFDAQLGGTGLVIVAPACQGRGIGRGLMDAILPSLGDRGVVLHATEAGAPLYRRLGFRHAGGVSQHQGIALPAGPVVPARNETLRRAGTQDLDVVATLDAAATGMTRSGVLAALRRVAEVVLLDRGGVACGFSMMRPFGRGLVIGPVVAPDEDAARQLIAYWICRHAGAFLRIDVSAGGGLSEWLAMQGLAPVDEVTRMVRAPIPPPGAMRRFALVSQALG